MHLLFFFLSRQLSITISCDSNLIVALTLFISEQNKANSILSRRRIVRMNFYYCPRRCEIRVESRKPFRHRVSIFISLLLDASSAATNSSRVIFGCALSLLSARATAAKLTSVCVYMCIRNAHLFARCIK